MRTPDKWYKTQKSSQSFSSRSLTLFAGFQLQEMNDLFRQSLESELRATSRRFQPEAVDPNPPVVPPVATSSAPIAIDEDELGDDLQDDGDGDGDAGLLSMAAQLGAFGEDDLDVDD